MLPIGPLLYARGATLDRVSLAVVVVGGGDGAPARLCPMDGSPVTPREIDRIGAARVWRWTFDLPAAKGAFYRYGEERHEVETDWAGVVKIAYVSCNGSEHEDPPAAGPARDALWHRLADEHRRTPLALMLHGGDQLYADDIVEAHPAVSAWARDPHAHARAPIPPQAIEAATAFLLSRYAQVFARPAYAALASRVPSLMMWDDHDIIDGWGSHAPAVQDSPIGQAIFAICRRLFVLLQLGGAGVAQRPPTSRADVGVVPTLSFAARFPGLRVIAPDLRSERRSDRILGDVGWTWLERALADVEPDTHVLLMSSVPLLGPRISWLEAMARRLPRAGAYRDDLNDQWQSRAHRDEWRRVLRLLDRARAERGCTITALSGEIHLATRGEMRSVREGPALLHQLVASGIAHPQPPALLARVLGLLAACGEAPLPARPSRLLPLPGRAAIYTAQRNYLLIERSPDGWTAAWELEHSGRTPALRIGASTRNTRGVTPMKAAITSG